MDNLIKDKQEVINIIKTVCNDTITISYITNHIMNLNKCEFKLLLHKIYISNKKRIDIALITI